MKTLTVEEALDARAQGRDIYYRVGSKGASAVLGFRSEVPRKYGFRYPNGYWKFVTDSPEASLTAALTHNPGTGERDVFLATELTPSAKIVATGKPELTVSTAAELFRQGCRTYVLTQFGRHDLVEVVGQFGFESHPGNQSISSMSSVSPKNAILSALNQGGKVCVMQSGVPFTVKPDEPATGLVPLGPNRTRLGRKVEVLKNDMKDRKGRLPILAVITYPDGKELVIRRRADGTPPHHRNGDLVGHLPPEPPKPREIWLRIEDGPNGQFANWSEKAPETVGYKLFREVLPDDELEDLRQWKSGMMQVLDELDLQEIGKEMDLTIGQSVSKNVLPFIKKLKALIRP